MKFTFALALLAAVSVANGATDDFINWAVNNGKNYNNVNEFGARRDTFLGNHQKVQDLNAKHAGKNVRFADNFMSDMTDDEFWGMLGLGAESDQGARLLEDTVEEGRLLEDSVEGRRLQASNVDWVAAGKMHPVKDQGYCGSCWAFNSSAAVEGMQAIKDDTAAVRISEQSAVDCTSGSCARGGWMYYAWDHWMAYGAMSNADYPYTAVDGAACGTIPS